MSDIFIIAIIGLATSALTMIPFLRQKQRMEKRAVEAEMLAEKYGLKEPASLHPIIAPESVSAQAVASLTFAASTMSSDSRTGLQPSSALRDV